jgi:putative SOS response-associated peptidase YedK
MCGRYTLTYADLGRVAELLGAMIDEGAAELHRPRYNVAPATTCVIARRRGSGPALVPAAWGLRLSGRFVINLRAETAALRLRDAYERGRAIVPADGFYEWHGERSDRRPVWFHAPDGAPLLMAALLVEAPDAPPAFAVLTSASRPPVAEIHDRMPVLFTPEGARAWLDRAPPTVRGAPVPLVAVDVSSRVNAAANDDPDCIAPATPPARQLDLFR